MRTYLEHVNVPAMISAASSCEEKITILQTIVQFGLDSVLPLKTKTVHLTEPPWISPVLKNLIKKRQRALSQGDYAHFRVLRNSLIANAKFVAPSTTSAEFNTLRNVLRLDGGRK